MRSRSFLPLLVSGLFGESSAAVPAADAPYCETVATRFTAAGLPAVAGWPALPTASATQLLPLPAAFGSALLLVGSDGALYQSSGHSSSMAFKPFWSGGAAGATYLVLPPPAAAPSADGGTFSGTFSLAVAAPAATAGHVTLATLSCTLHDGCKPGGGGAGAPSAPIALGTADEVSLASAGGTLWAGGPQGLVSWPTQQQQQQQQQQQRGDKAAAAVTWHVKGSDIGAVATSAPSPSSPPLVAAGGSEKLWLLDGATGQTLRWEWVTDIPSEAGGAIADTITALAFGEPDEAFAEEAEAEVAAARGGGLPAWRKRQMRLAAAGAPLYIGSADALNVRHANGTIERVDGERGLPWGNITSLALLPADTADGAARRAELWLGSSRGLVVLRGAGSGDFSHDQWRYLSGPRWHPGEAVLAVVPLRAQAVVALTDGGASLLEQQCDWTLARKAAHYEAIWEGGRQDRHGLVAACALPAAGDVAAPCAMGDGDNDGLWTSIVLAAEAFRHATARAEGDAAGAEAARAAVALRLSGMQLLYNVTGVPGLMARSCVDPTEAHGGTHDRETWRNVTVRGYEGWLWKGDTSSDEVVGHMFGYPVVGDLLAAAAQEHSDGSAALARQLQLSTVAYIVSNGFNLIDSTGNATTWGKYAPDVINVDRGFSDGRGIQSLQVLAMIAAANATLAKDPKAGAAVPVGRHRTMALNTSFFEAGYATLTNASNQYDDNVLNAKILTPGDDNFSDVRRRSSSPLRPRSPPLPPLTPPPPPPLAPTGRTHDAALLHTPQPGHRRTRRGRRARPRAGRAAPRVAAGPSR